MAQVGVAPFRGHALVGVEVGAGNRDDNGIVMTWCEIPSTVANVVAFATYCRHIFQNCPHVRQRNSFKSIALATARPPSVFG